MEPGWLDEIEPATSPPFVRLGTRALGGGAWLLGGPDVPAQLTEKHRILATHHHDAVAALDGTEPAATELLETLWDHLPERPLADLPGLPGLPGPNVEPAHPAPGRARPPGAARPDPRRPNIGVRGEERPTHPSVAAGSGSNRGSPHRPVSPAAPPGNDPGLARRPTPAAAGTTSPAGDHDVAAPLPSKAGQLDAPDRSEPAGLHPIEAGPYDPAPVAPDGRPTAGQMHPIDAAGRLVAEDLCLLVPRDGGWVLGAGSVCFPSHWRLTGKLGLPLAAVHGPVPDYATELADRVDRFLDKLRAGRGVVRRNWTVHSEPDLYAPDVPPPPDPPVAPAEAGQRLWLRSERQTLTRLPRTGAIVFTIRTQQVRLAAVATHPDLRSRLARAVAAWPPHQTAYRGGEAVCAPLLAWLRLGDRDRDRGR